MQAGANVVLIDSLFEARVIVNALRHYLSAHPDVYGKECIEELVSYLDSMY